MNASAAATATSYVGWIIVVAMWIDGAAETGSWHVSAEVVTACCALLVQIAHNLSPLWRASLKKIFGYDPYADGKETP